MIPTKRGHTKAGLFSLKPLQRLAARLFPYTNEKMLCPPGPVPTGPLPPLVVSSLMRSGTHLVIDLLLNNVAGYRQSPLYLDYDSYIFEGFSEETLLSAGSCVVKTHVAHRPFDQQAGNTLRTLAERGVVIIPVRDPEKIYRSMINFGYHASPGEFAALHARHLDFWKGHDPILVNFEDLLLPEKVGKFLAEVRERAGLEAVAEDSVPFVALASRATNLLRKLRTRIQGCNAPKINTTVGFKL